MSHHTPQFGSQRSQLVVWAIMSEGTLASVAIRHLHVYCSDYMC
jgi:hypothetical protein